MLNRFFALLCLACIFSATGNCTTDSSRFVYTDNFEDEKVTAQPSHWIESNKADNWEVVNDKGNKVYRVNRVTKRSYSWLHVFERNIVFQSAFKIIQSSSKNISGIGFSVRQNAEEAQVSIRYNIVDRCWYLEEQRGFDFPVTLLARSSPVILKPGEWNRIKMVANENHIAFYYNNMDRPVLVSDSVKHLSPGRVALFAENTEVYFDNIDLVLVSRQGSVNDGVLEYNLVAEDGKMREGATVFEKNNGTLLLLHRDEEFRSADRGQTFEGPFPVSFPYNGDAHHSVIRLQSRKILKMVAQYATEKHAFDAPLYYQSKISEDDGATWYDGGVTWNGFASDALTMNDKLSQMPDGRIFFVITRRTNVDQKERGHKSVIYYSDNDGATWDSSRNDTKSISKLFHYCESKVIYTTDGKLRLYTPWSEAPSIHYAASDDNGVTWKGDKSSDSLRNAKSSFGLAEDMYASTPTFYMVWVYNDMYASMISYLPRSRLALARSYDGKNWEYLMDVERWISPANMDISGAKPTARNRRTIVQIIDPGITVTKDYLYITMGRSERASDKGHNELRLRICRIEKSKLRPYKEWPKEH